MCNATVPSTDKSPAPPSLFIPHHVAACVRPDAAAWTRLSSGGNSSPQTARPVASPAQWSPGSSLDLWCKSFYYFFSICSVTEKGNNYKLGFLGGCGYLCRSLAVQERCAFRATHCRPNNLQPNGHNQSAAMQKCCNTA